MDNNKEPFFSITKKDFDIQWFSGTGPGGQSRNKSSNCCRLVHKETGYMEVGQNYKSRQQNLRDAFKRIVPKLIDYYFKKESKERFSAPQGYVRTYNQPDNRVSDTLSDFQAEYKKVVDKVDTDMIDDMMKAFAYEIHVNNNRIDENG